MPPAPSMQPYADKYDPSVFPLRTVLVLLVGSIGASYWLVPRQDQLVERLFLDKQYQRMAEALKSGLQDSSKFKVSDMRLMTAEQLTTLSHLLRLTPREQLAMIFQDSRPPKYDQFVHGLVLGAVRYVDVIQPKDAWQMIQPHLLRLAPTQQIEVAQLLAANSHAVGQPALAASILHPVVRLAEAEWGLERDLALAYRWSAQTKKGAVELRQWLQSRRTNLSAEDLSSGLKLGHAMAVEAGEPSLALDFALESLARFGADEAVPEQEMEAAHSLAIQCARTADVLPWLQRYVAQLPLVKID